MFNIRRQTYACDLDLYLISTHKLLRFSPMSFEAMRLGFSILIFHFLVVVLERINLVLLGSTKACQFLTINKSHKTGSDNTGACTTSHCLALLSHIERW